MSKIGRFVSLFSQPERRTVSFETTDGGYLEIDPSIIVAIRGAGPYWTEVLEGSNCRLVRGTLLEVCALLAEAVADTWCSMDIAPSTDGYYLIAERHGGMWVSGYDESGWFMKPYQREDALAWTNLPLGPELPAVPQQEVR